MASVVSGLTNRGNGRYAVLVDGSFLTKVLRIKAPKNPNVIEEKVREGLKEITNHIEKVKKHPELQAKELLRIYYYDAPPFVGEIPLSPGGKEKVDMGKSSPALMMGGIHGKLEHEPDFALRLGEVRHQGYDLKSGELRQSIKREEKIKNVQPKFVQKGVDMRIGLDIARLSLLKLVDSIAVITGDSDFIPALKFARREGIRVYLDTCGLKGNHAPLKAHADKIIS